MVGALPPPPLGPVVLFLAPPAITAEDKVYLLYVKSNEDGEPLLPEGPEPPAPTNIG